MGSMNPDRNEQVRHQLPSTVHAAHPGVLHSAFAVLRVLGRMQFPVGVTRLAAETGIPKTTVHRLLEQLADENVVERVGRRWVLVRGLHDLDRRLPESAIWLALNSGRLTAEYRVMHPDCCAIAAPLCLPSGEGAALGFGLPGHCDMEPFKAPLAAVASRIESDMLRLVS